MTTQLYDLPSPFQELLEMDFDNEPEELAVIGPTLSEIEHEVWDGLGAISPEQMRAVERQLLRMGRVIKQLKQDEEVLAGHISQTQGKLDANRRRQDFLKVWMLNLMEQSGLEKAKDPLVSVYTQRNPKSIELEDDAQVPVQYQRATWRGVPSLLPPELREQATVEPNKTALMEHIEETGELFPGVTLITDRKHVRVR